MQETLADDLTLSEFSTELGGNAYTDDDPSSLHSNDSLISDTYNTRS